MERLYSLQGLRGAAVLGVVLFHMASVEAKYSGGDLLLPALVDFFQLGVDLGIWMKFFNNSVAFLFIQFV